MKFAVIGLNHGHIWGMIQGLLNTRQAELAGFLAREPELQLEFSKRHPGVPLRAMEDLLKDSEIQLIVSAAINNERAGLAVESLKAGKHFLVDKPPVTTVDHVQMIEKAVAQSGKLYFVLYGERMESRENLKAKELIDQGEIGRIVSVMGWGPHRLNIKSRPSWMFNQEQYGGIINDIGSHQIERFIWLTGERIVRWNSRVGNFATRQHSDFHDFGDSYFEGEKGTTGYVRVDWLTPDGAPRWGDVRAMIVGTHGTIEIRSVYNVAPGMETDDQPLIILTSHSRKSSRIDVSAVPIRWAEVLLESIASGRNLLNPPELTFHAMRVTVQMQRDALVLPVR